MSAPSLPSESITWRICLRSEPRRVFELLSTAEGRESFWAESAPEVDGFVRFLFPSGERLEARILDRVPDRSFSIHYFDGTTVRFEIGPHPEGGSLVTLRETGLTRDHLLENSSGWVSVLLALKAAADFGVDLRNHDPRFTWKDRFVDN